MSPVEWRKHDGESPEFIPDPSEPPRVVVWGPRADDPTYVGEMVLRARKMNPKCGRVIVVLDRTSPQN